MRKVYPSYYPNFSCIAQDCHHTCCKGWEIDVDPESLARYQSLQHPLAARLQAEIVQEDGEAHFRLREDESCPFLQKNGLCELILQLGEDALCQICQDHPRFRNFFSDRTESGVGLCCEAAARLVLTQATPVFLMETGEETLTPEEEWILATRADYLAIAQDRTRPLAARWDALAACSGFSLKDRSPAQWATFYADLERLDSLWEERLASLREVGHFSVPAAFSIPLEQLTVYFLYRHLPGALLDGDLPGRTAFCVLSAAFVAALLSAAPTADLETLVELAREYSAEIEYSEDNLCALLDAVTVFPENLR